MNHTVVIIFCLTYEEMYNKMINQYERLWECQYFLITFIQLRWKSENRLCITNKTALMKNDGFLDLEL